MRSIDIHGVAWADFDDVHDRPAPASFALTLPQARRGTLLATFGKLQVHPGVVVEFAPRPTRPDADRRHFIVAMPEGVRLTFV